MLTPQDLAAQISAAIEANAEAGDDLLLSNLPVISRELIDELRASVRRRLAQNLSQARRIAKLAVAAADRLPGPDPAANGSAQWAMGNVHYFANEIEQSIARYRQAIDCFQMVEDHEAIRQLQGNLIGVLMDFGALDEAEQIGLNLLDSLRAQPLDVSIFNLRLNLGTLAQRRGQYAASLEHLHAAERIAGVLNLPVRRAQSLVNQAVSAEKLDRFGQAEALLKVAREIFQAEGESADEGLAWLNDAILDYRQGRWQAALLKFEQAGACFQQAELDDELPTVWQYQARCYLALNLAREALQAVTAAEAAFSARKMPREVAYAAHTQGTVYRALRRPAPALSSLDRARRLFSADGERVEAALVGVQHASLLIDMRQAAQAQLELSEALQVLTPNEFPIRHTQAQIEVARGRLAVGQVLPALEALSAAWRVGRRDGVRPPAHLAFPIHYLRGVIAEAVDRLAEAQAEYRAAIEAAQLVNAQLSAPELRSGWMDDKRPAFEASIRLALQRGDFIEAFLLSERARTAVLHTLLDNHVSEADKSIVTLKARWTALSTNPSQSVSPEALVEVERNLAEAYRLQVIHASQQLEFVPPQTMSEVQLALAANMALLVFETLGDELLAWVLTSTEVQIVRRLAAVSVTRREVIGLIHMLEEATLFEPARLSQLAREANREAARLAQHILAPLMALLPQTITQVHVVPVGPLISLPWAWLWSHSGARPDVEIELRPTARQGRRDCQPTLCGPHTIPTACVLGFSPDRQLPFVEAEAEAVAAQWSNRCYVGEAATLHALRADAQHASIIHIAAHAVFRQDNPMFSALRLADGWLTAHDALGLPLTRRPLVVLSACQTGAATLRGGEVLGLVGSFLQAGASAVVVSQWRVDDARTAQWMVKFYEQLKLDRSPATALLQAQQHVCALQPHPYYWAGFNVWCG